MSHTAKHRTVVPPEYWENPKEHSRKIAQSVRGILEGKTNNHYTVTLEAGKTVTDVRFLSARAGVSVLVTPQNAAAAALMRTTDLYAIGAFEKVTVHHDASAVGTEVFSLLIAG